MEADPSMKIGIFYRDFYGRVGVPIEYHKIAHCLSRDHEVSCFGKRLDDSVELPNSHYFNSWRDLHSAARQWLEQRRPEAVVLVGGFIPENIPVANEARKRGILTVLSLCSHFMDYAFTRKLFSKNPDIKKLNKGVRTSDGLKDRVVAGINPTLKKLYSATIGRKLMSLMDYVAVFSEIEAAQCAGRFGKTMKPLMKLRWGIDDLPEEPATGHYFYHTLGFNDQVSNIVYWGRIDWKMKGLDNLMNGVVEAARRKPQPGFRLFLMGPGYRDGEIIAQQFVERHQLQDLVHIKLPGSYVAGSKAPLRDADISVLMSRWDGFPRALRESIYLGVPILVTPETHFADLTEQFGCGVVIGQPGAAEAVADVLLSVGEQQNIAAMKEGCARLKKDLTTPAVVGHFIGQLEAALADH